MNILIVGASGGIGYGFVEILLQDPAIDRVYGTYRRWESAQDLLNLASRYPQRLVCLSMDITQESDLVVALETISHQTRELDLVVNCIGILHRVGLQPEKSLRQINSDRLIEYFQVNSIGAVLLAKHLLPFFSSPRRHVFATISAKLGSIGDNYLGGWYGYRASKAALNMLMRTVAIEYSRKSPQTIVVICDWNIPPGIPGDYGCSCTFVRKCLDRFADFAVHVGIIGIFCWFRNSYHSLR
ncbi:SDR family NAD(P)-dependent oxidoreductase [Limnospira fusiformis]|uniref:SDR family NAD(P)-dependent oxidoreductase n=1 Tax=Limnospira fusiformis TaxID=54297 RepID=UPI0034E08540